MARKDESPVQVRTRPIAEKSKDELDRELDAALADSFPASDPVAMEIPARRDRSRTASQATSVNVVREVVGVFDDLPALEAAIADLQSSGFDRAELSMVAGQKTVERELGHLYEKVSELEDDPNVPRDAYVPRESIGEGEGALIGGLVYVGAIAAAGAVVASGGTLAAVITAAAVSGGAGGFVGGILANILAEHHADYLRRQLERGGILLWVRVWDAKDERTAISILTKHSAHDVHAHNIPVQG